MPNYGLLQAGGQLTALFVGDLPLYLFNAETPGAGQASVAFARGDSPSGMDAGTTFDIFYVAAPTAELHIQGSNVDVEAQYQDLWISSNKQNDNYTDTARWKFYRAKLVSQSAGGAVTVVAKR